MCFENDEFKMVLMKEREGGHPKSVGKYDVVLGSENRNGEGQLTK